MWGVDLTHTTHTGAQTGIQQVCRELMTGLSADGFARPLVYDRFARMWRGLDRRERRFLSPEQGVRPSVKRSGRWTMVQKLNGMARKFRKGPGMPEEIEALLVPEIFDPVRDPVLAAVGLPKVAVFHDAIPLIHPEWTPRKTVRRFPDYVRALAGFDLVICDSRSSERDLLAYWEKQGIAPLPATRTIPLGVPASRVPARPPGREERHSARPRVLMIGTLEARKNHLALLEACESLWQGGRDFELLLVGLLNRETGRAVQARIEALQAAGRPLRWEGAATDEQVVRFLETADCFVYPSRYEGFGIPVVEALAHGLPCVVPETSSLAELIPGGGCLPCGTDREGIRAALEKILTDPAERARLAAEARDRPVRTMRDHAAEVRQALQAFLQEKQ